MGIQDLTPLNLKLLVFVKHTLNLAVRNSSRPLGISLGPKVVSAHLARLTPTGSDMVKQLAELLHLAPVVSPVKNLAL